MNKKYFTDIGEQQLPIILTNLELNTLLHSVEFRMETLRDEFLADGPNRDKMLEGTILLGALDKIEKTLGDNTYHKIADRALHEN